MKKFIYENGLDSDDPAENGVWNRIEVNSKKDYLVKIKSLTTRSGSPDCRPWETYKIDNEIVSEEEFLAALPD
jgi:hypothetical protein